MPGKYRKRPEFIDVDNAVIAPKHLKGEYVKNLPTNQVLQAQVGASYSGKMGGLPYQTMQTQGVLGDATPIQRRNRLSPNPQEEHQ
jgi:hypothetical protein